MKKHSTETVDVVVIFGRILLGILTVFLFGVLLLHYNISNNDDVYNWTSLTIEIGIGIGITWTVWKFSKRDQVKITQLVEEIQKIEHTQFDMNKKLLDIIEQQDKSRKEKEEIVYRNLIHYLHLIKIDVYERRLFEIALKENKPTSWDFPSLMRSIEFDIKKLESLTIIDRPTISAEHISHIEHILLLARMTRLLTRWSESTYVVYAEFKKEINNLIEKLTQIYPVQVSNQYTNDSDYQ